MTNAVAALSTIPLGAPTEYGEAKAPRVYRLEKSFAVVRFEATGNGRIVFLPAGAELKVVGSSRLSECFEVLWQDQLYSIFRVDLLGPWSNPRSNPRRLGSTKSKIMKACA